MLCTKCKSLLKIVRGDYVCKDCKYSLNIQVKERIKEFLELGIIEEKHDIKIWEEVVRDNELLRLTTTTNKRLEELQSIRLFDEYSLENGSSHKNSIKSTLLYKKYKQLLEDK